MIDIKSVTSQNRNSPYTDKIILGDALESLRSLPDGFVNCIVTSPPYYGLRDYGCDGQIGLEKSPDEYVARLVEVFREARRVLTNDGTLWLNIADSYGGAGHGRDSEQIQRRYWKKSDAGMNLPKNFEGVKPKDMCGIPWTLALALRADGWYLRSDIIWQKTNALPHSVKDRPVSSYEHIFLLAKSKKYYFDYTALEEPMLEGSKERYKRGFGVHKYSIGIPGRAPQGIDRRKTGEVPIPETRRGRDVWALPTTGCKAAHFAVFPIELPKRCILAGCPENGIVLDPFFGAGTTGAAAVTLGRRYIGIELNPEYIVFAEERVEKTRKEAKPANDSETNTPCEPDIAAHGVF